MSAETPGQDTCPSNYQLMPRTAEEALAIYLGLPGLAILDPATPVTSLGSCFADNLRIHLKTNRFNYLQCEPECAGFSANWGRVYNTASMRQIFSYSEEQRFEPPERWWIRADGQVADPYRAIADYPGLAEAERDFQAHLGHSREALRSAKVLILTIGLTETWRSRLDGATFHGRPAHPDPALHAFHVRSFEEVQDDLRQIHASARRLNPGVRMIFTVSPVPLRASFRSDVCAVDASSHSKAVLLAALRSFVADAADTFYFPSFELVRDVLNARPNAHGTYDQAVLDTVMKVFDGFFVDGK